MWQVETCRGCRHEVDLFNGTSVCVFVDSSNLSGSDSPLDLAIYTHGNNSISSSIATSYAEKLTTILFNLQFVGTVKQK